MKKINTIILGIAAIVFTMASCSNSKEEVSHKQTPIAVRVKQVQEQARATQITVSGTVQGVNNAEISTRMMGVVTDVAVGVGDVVQKGTLLLTIDASDIKAQLAQAKANVVKAEANFMNTKKNFDRFKNLFEKKSATQKELDDITTQFKAAASQLEIAKEAVNQVNAQLSYTNIRAPFTGVITSKMIKKGSLANPGAPLLTLEENNNFEVKGSVSESDINNISKSKPVTVVIPSIDTSFEGTITELSNSSTNMGGQYQLIVSVPKLKNMYSGMYAKLMINTNDKGQKQGIIIPKSALRHKGQLIGLYTLSESNTAVLRWVKTGREMGNDIEIVSGLTTNEKYIVSADGKLYNGAKVTVNQ